MFHRDSRILRSVLGASVFGLLLIACGTSTNTNTNNNANSNSNNNTGNVTFSQVYQQVIKISCAFQSCHGGGAGGLNLKEEDAYLSLLNTDSNLVSGKKRVIPKDPDNSVFWQVLKGKVGSVRQMPPTEPLEQSKMDLVRSWIEQGAAK